MFKKNADYREISVHALNGNATHNNAIRIQRKIEGQPIRVLIDSGSTHSFIDPSTFFKM